MLTIGSVQTISLSEGFYAISAGVFVLRQLDEPDAEAAMQCLSAATATAPASMAAP